MPLSFWADAFSTSCYLINRPPLSTLHGKTPIELLFGTKPDYMQLKSFGCLCYPYLRPYAPNKLLDRSLECVFIGYHSQYKGYLCYNIATHRLYISRHVRFEESIFPYSLHQSNTPTVSTISSPVPLSTSHLLSHITPSPTYPVPMPTTVTSPCHSANPLPNHPTPLSQHDITESVPSQRNIAEPIISPLRQLPQSRPPTLSEPSLPNTADSPIPSVTHPTSVVPMLPTSEPPPVPAPPTHNMITRSKHGITKPLHKLCLQATKHPLQPTDYYDPTSSPKQSSMLNGVRQWTVRLLPCCKMVPGHLLRPSKTKI